MASKSAAKKPFNLGGLVGGVQKILDAVQDIAPVAQTFGGPVVANVATLVISGAAIIENILQRSSDGAIVLATQDEGKLRAMLAELQTANDRLAGLISES